MDAARSPSPKKARSNSSSPLPSKPSTPSPDCQAERSVWVAVRARPLVARERLEGAKACISVNKALGSVHLGAYRQFSYDYAFGPEAQQQDVFAGCVSQLVDAVLEGCTATVLAYGPTGSGKTHTMGMGTALHTIREHHGIIPRVIRQLFDAAAAAPNSTQTVIKAQFLEIYNEELRDLLAGAGQGAAGSCAGGAFGTAAAAGSATQQPQRGIAIRECPDGQIIVTGAREVSASSPEDLLKLLDAGTLARATGGTLLNEQSSRSHAIFTISVEQSISTALYSASSRKSCLGSTSSTSTADRPCCDHNENSGTTITDSDSSCQSEYVAAVTGGSSMAEGVKALNQAEAPATKQVEYRFAKIHLVDLAGSERASRSGAAGVRLREAVNINQGLLALGNVISALSDERRPGRHVPYRDSKLTRLLQDSLGGNSKTLMIACVSSADDAVEESLNTLKYAARARSIRNRPVLNRQILGDDSRGVAAEIQALQLLLLRRVAQQMLGPACGAVVPEMLLKDVTEAGSGSDTRGDASRSYKSFRLLQELQAMASSTGPLLLELDACQHSDQQQRPLTFSQLTQQLADLEAQVASSNSHISRLELQLEIASAEQQALEQATYVLREQQASAWGQLLHVIEELHEGKQLSGTGRQQLRQVAEGHQQQAGYGSLVKSVESASLHTDASPEMHGKCQDAQAVADHGTLVPDAHAGQQASAQGLPGIAPCAQIEELSQKLAKLQAEVAEQTALLEVAQGDLNRDELIFADKAKEVARLQAELDSAAERAQRREQAMAARLQHMQADLRRWRERALALQTCPTDPAQRQEWHALPPPPQSPSCRPSLPSSRSAAVSLQQELSFAALPHKQQQGRQVQRHGDAAELQEEQHLIIQQHAATSAGRPPCLLLDGSAVDTGQAGGDGVTGDDEVLFDADLASYISDTDYTDLQCGDLEADSHLQAELQVVLADKAALEEEKAAAQAEAAAAQRAFEHSRAMLEGQLSQLSAAISSQEALIATLQANEAEAKSMGALYLERCRELEAELADLNLDLQELTTALAKVEADAAASAEEKQVLRQEYEGKIEAVVKQMAGLQQQMKQQDGARLDKERQRASGRVQQLQAELSAMKAQQNSLQKRLQERLAAQEKEAATKSRELASLRRAADAARKRVLELEEDNRRQKVALKARSNEAAAAQRQLRELTSRVSPVRSRPGHSPKASPRGSTCRSPPQSTSPSSSVNAAVSPQSARCAASGVSPRGPDPSLSPRQTHRGAGYAASHANSQEQRRRNNGGSSAGSEQLGSGEQGVAGAQEGPSCNHTTRPSSKTGGSRVNSTSSSSSSHTRQLLTKQVQLLVSEHMAKHRLQRLQAKQEAVLLRRDQLLAAKAQVELKKLRRCPPTTAAGGSAAEASCSSTRTGSKHPAEELLLEDFADQLDAVGAQQQHIQQLMSKAAADAASAADAAGRLLSAASSMSKHQLQELLGLALKELALQAAECQETVLQAKRLQVELSDAQQHLHETTCCLQMVQLQHQTQLAELQREHERRTMVLVRQQMSSGVTAVHASGAAEHKPGVKLAACGRTAADAANGSAPGAAILLPGAPSPLYTAGPSSQLGQPPHGSRLMDLLRLLAQQGNEGQQQKLLSTLSRLQQLQLAQHCPEQPQGSTQHTPQQPGLPEDHVSQQRHQQHVVQQHHEGTACAAVKQQQQEQQQQGILLEPLHGPEQPQSHLMCLKQCRAQQRLEQQQRQADCQQSPRLQRGLVQDCQEPSQPVQPVAPQQQEAQSQVQRQQEKQFCATAATADSADVVLRPAGTKRPSNCSSSCSSSSNSGSGTGSDSDDSTSSSHEARSSNRRCSLVSSSGGAGGSRSPAGESLRASASRLQAKLSSYHVNAPAGRRVSGSGGTRLSSQLGSPSSLPHVAAAEVAPGLGGRQAGRPIVTAATSKERVGGAASPTAAMLRKAAQLAIRTSMDMGAPRRVSSARITLHLSHDHLAPVLTAPADAPPDTPSSKGSAASSTAGMERASAGSLLHGLSSSRSSSDHSSLRCSSSAGGLASPGASAGAAARTCGQQDAHKLQRSSNSSTDCLRPAVLDVSCVSQALEQRPLSSSAGHFQKHTSPSVSAQTAGAFRSGFCIREFDAVPASAAMSPGKDTCKGVVPPSLLSLTASAAAAGAGGMSPAALCSPQGRSPYLQYKASAAAAAAASAGKDQQQVSPGPRSSRGRSGMPHSPPSSYMRLVRGTD